MRFISDIASYFLPTAVRRGWINCAKFLIWCGGDVSQKAYNSERPYIHHNFLLKIACETKQPKMIDLLKTAGINIFAADTNGITQLHIEAERPNNVDNIDVITTLLKYYDVNTIDIKNRQGNTALCLACKVADTDIGLARVDLLIQKSARVDTIDRTNSHSNQYDTLLHAACRRSGFSKLIDLLLKYTPNVNIKNGYQLTPLQVAFHSERWAHVEQLIKAKTKIDFIDNNTSFLQAVYYSDAPTGIKNKLCKLLLEHGADPNIKLVFPTEAPKIKRSENLYDVGLDLQHKDRCNGTPLLHVMLLDGNIELLNHFIDQGADVTIADENGTTLLHLACTAKNSPNADLIAKIVATSNNINATNSFGQTALHIACSPGNFVAINELIKLGADVDLKDQSGNTPLHILASIELNAPYELLQELITASKGKDINSTNNNGQTALHVACNVGNYNMVCQLIQLGVNPSLQDANGNTALHLAIEHSDKGDNLKTIRKLLYSGSDILATNNLKQRAVFNLETKFKDQNDSLLSFKKSLFASSALFFRSHGAKQLPCDAGKGAMQTIFTFLWGDSTLSKDVYEKICKNNATSKLKS